MPTILITGGTGMIGRALTNALLERNHQVIILTRRLPRMHYGSRVRYALWDTNKGTIDTDAISQADFIIHLAGANVGEKRWTDQRKKEIADSRIKSGELIVKATREIQNKIKAVISASAMGWYGPDPSVPNPRPFTEEDPAYNDFLGQTCLKWEQSLEPLTHQGIRLVKLRTGIVLSKNGGALKEFMKPLRFGLATILGSGKQIISWIHIDDLVNLYIIAIEKDDMKGVYNAVAPKPVSNREFILQLARSRNGQRFIAVRVPAFILKLVLGEMSIEVLKSVTLSCEKTKRAGFVFKYPALEDLHNYFRPTGRRV
jgi:uncharacterized protein